MPLIPIELIHAPPMLVRAHPADAEADAALQASIGALGLLQPVLLRRHGNHGYDLIAGARRLAACKALGLAQIAAEVQTFNDGAAVVAGVAENMVRAPMAPLDQWRAVARIRADGFTIEHAAICIGVSLRHARQLEKLSRLHPSALAAIAKHGMPSDHDMALIANAPAKVQAEAMKAVKAGAWHEIAGRCEVHRIPRSRAIFDVAASNVAFEEDLFLQPEAQNREFTTDIAGFMAAQQAALEQQVKDRQAKKQRVQIGDLDKNNSLVIPKGFERSLSDPDKPKRAETVLLVMIPSGYYIGEVMQRVIAPKTKPKPAAAKRKNLAADADDADDRAELDETSENDGDDDAEAPQPEAAEESRAITAAGRKLIAERKTAALRDHLMSCADRPAEELLAWMVIALSADTVSLQTSATTWAQHKMLDLVRELVSPAGAVALNLDNAKAAAVKALVRILGIKPDATCLPAEWIGHASGADAALPRFDTPELLAQVSGAELKRLAVEHGIKPAKTVARLREQLAGKLDNWRPAQFGAPGPRPA